MFSLSAQKPGGIRFILRFQDSEAGILKGIICELLHIFEHFRAGIKYKCLILHLSVCPLNVLKLLVKQYYK